MNKVLLIGRLVRDPETKTTGSGIKFSRFTIAVNRQFGEDQSDFIPVVAWRSQADFVEKFMKKGALISVEGRFSSNTFQNSENKTVYSYEVAADRVEALETKAQTSARLATGEVKHESITSTQVMKFEEEVKEDTSNIDVPWEMDL